MSDHINNDDEKPWGTPIVNNQVPNSSAERFPAGTTYSGTTSPRIATSPQPLQQSSMPVVPPTAASAPYEVAPVATPPSPPTASPTAYGVAPSQPTPMPVYPPTATNHQPAPNAAPTPAPWAYPGQPTPAPGTPGFGGDASDWLSKPQNIKLLIGWGGFAVGALILLMGDADTALIGVAVMVVAWAVGIRNGYHEKAGLRLQTRLDADQTTRLVTDLAATQQGPFSSVQFTGSEPGRLNFTARGGGDPLTFRFELRPDPAGWTFVSTHLIDWTWRRTRWNFIPVPFTKSMDSYGLYKSFSTRVHEALKQHDPLVVGQFHSKATD